MPAFSPRVGSRHLTLTGAPVQILEVRADAVMLQSLASDNRIRVPACYPLRPFDPEQAVWEARPNPYSPRSRKADASKSPAQAKPLAPLIDAMLLAGGKTMRGILRELRRKASAACGGKDLKANVRARLYWLRKRGHHIHWNGRECVQATPTPDARSASTLTPACRQHSSSLPSTATAGSRLMP